MWGKCARLLMGFILFVVAGWLVVHAAFGWNEAWRLQRSSAAKHDPVPLIDPALTSDPSIDAAKLKVIGPLANALNAQAETSTSASPANPVTAVDHVEKAAASAPRRFHASFSVKSYRYFRLLVPAHISSPSLRGSFTSYSAGPAKNVAIVDFLVLDDSQFSDFVGEDGGSTVFSSETSGGIVDIALGPTFFESKKYYLVFRSPDNRSRLVTADLTATFD